MACHSLRHRGEELLGAVRGPGIPDVPWTSGIPLLHPWANRLGGLRLRLRRRGRRARARLAGHLPRAARAAAARPAQRGRRLGGARAERRGAWSPAASWPGCAAFPFDHRVEVAAELSEQRADADDDLTATGSRPVPIVFGYHPYLQLPGVPRAEWEITMPVGDRLLLDERLVPTGERAPAGDLDGPLGDRTFDDGFTLDALRGPFVLAGGGRRIELAFESGYPYAQVFAPAISDVICFEPMTAPADALRHSPAAVAPGESFSARFSVSVISVPRASAKRELA